MENYTKPGSIYDCAKIEKYEAEHHYVRSTQESLVDITPASSILNLPRNSDDLTILPLNVRSSPLSYSAPVPPIVGVRNNTFQTILLISWPDYAFGMSPEVRASALPYDSKLGIRSAER